MTLIVCVCVCVCVANHPLDSRQEVGGGRDGLISPLRNKSTSHVYDNFKESISSFQRRFPSSVDFSGEEFLKVSGVLATVVLGVTMNAEKTMISPEVEKFLHRYAYSKIYLFDYS